MSDEGRVRNNQSKEKKPRVTSWFSRKTYATAFGRYEGIGPSEEPENEILLGRRRERARFLDLLFSVGGKGAYLITGHRGSGKTTFVDYCLAEYRRDIFERFLRGNVGRAFLWDRLGLTAIAFVLLMAGVLIHESLLYLLAHPIHWIVRIPFLILFALLALFPFIAALSRLELLFERMGTTLRRRARDSPDPSSRDLGLHAATFLFGRRQPNPRPLAVLLVLCALILICLPISNSLDTIAQMILLCGWAFYSATTISLLFGESLSPSERQQSEISSMIDRAIWTVLMMIGGCGLLFVIVPHTTDPNTQLILRRLPLAAAAAFLGLGLLGVAAQKRHALETWSPLSAGHLGFDRSVQSITSSALWHQLAGIAALILSLFLLIWCWARAEGSLEFLLLISLGTAIPFITISWWAAARHFTNVKKRKPDPGKNQPKSDAHKKRQPSGDAEGQNLEARIRSLQLAASGALQRPTMLLILKATILVVIGLQVSFPLFSTIARSLAEGARDLSNPWMLSWLPKALESVEPYLFKDIYTELLTVAGWLVLLGFINFLEYEWIVRAHHRERLDPALRTMADGVSASPSLADAYHDRPYHLRLVKQTFFYEIYASWLPVLLVPVNLGFDTLDHRRVVEAMLAGLRDVYKKTFFRWSSLFYLATRVLSLMLTLGLTAFGAYHAFCLEPRQIGDLRRERFCAEHVPASSVRHLLEGPLKVRLPTADAPDLEIERKTGPDSPPEEPPWDKARTVPPAMRLACHVAGEPLAQFLQWDLAWQRNSKQKPAQPPPEVPFLQLFFPETQAGATPTSVTSASTPVRLRLYHPLLFLMFNALLGWFFSRYPLLPYTKTLRSIEELLANLSSRLHEESRVDTSPLSRILSFFTGTERVRHRDADPLDPRSVELATLAILRDIQSPTIQLPFLTHHRANLPAPEIIFKFDELDKLGLGVIPPHDTTGPETVHSDQLNRDRHRSQALRQLFSDLKNVVSCGKARFIFVGGRNLHDEWLADQTARRPLLTNIFEDELYLHSLMIDNPSNHDAERLWKGIEAFVILQRQRAEALNQKSLDLRIRPWLTPWVTQRAEPAFAAPLPNSRTPGQPSSSDGVEGASGQNDEVAPSSWLEHRAGIFWEKLVLPTLRCLGLELKNPEIRDREDHEPDKNFPLGNSIWCCDQSSQAAPRWHPTFQRDFIHFLTYRSQGNVKQIRTLLEEFIFPAGTVMATEKYDELAFDCQHVLRFRDIDRFRIQMIADIYRQIAAAFDPRLAYRDDKLVVGVLYLSDFLLKFHRRAFAWSSLQKVDELAHIHRAPDLPHAISEMVHHWTEPLLHSIRNGMYDFRFNSDCAREIEYLSRRSEEELAAFNFTLDESQALKAIYRSRIDAVKEPESWEFIAALGELHEFDEEYEVARYYYAQAIDLLDRHFHSQVASPDATPAVYQVLSDRSIGQEVMRRRLSWGVSRLRIKLQIGMSFEKAREFEQAQVHYRNARTLAAAILEALLSPEWEMGNPDPFYSDTPDEGGPDYISTLKHLNIVFQPAFAEAWVSEKVVGGIDTSLRLLERRLWELRWQLPLVRTEFLKPGKRAAQPSHSGQANFALAMTEQHNKAGDLYFFKGHQPPLATRLEASCPYLGRAQYHYALSLHEIRFFNHYRRQSMEQANRSIGIDATIDLADGSWGDFVFRAAAGSLADLSDTLLAQTSFFEILKSFSPVDEDRDEEEGRFLDSIDPCSAGIKSICGVIRNWLTESPEIGSRPKSKEDQDTAWGEAMARIFSPGPGRGPKGLPSKTSARSPGPLSRWLGSPLFLDHLPMESPSKRSFEPGYLDPDPDSKTVRPLKTVQVGQLLDFGPAPPSDEQRMIHYFIFCLSAGDMLARAGYLQDAARKHLRVVEAVTHYIWWIASICCLGRARSIAGPRGSGLASPLFGAESKEPPSWRARAWQRASAFGSDRLIKDVLEIAVYALGRASDLSQRGRVHIEPLVLAEARHGNHHLSPHQSLLIGRQVPVKMLTLTCSLALGCINLGQELEETGRGQEPEPSQNLRQVLVGLQRQIDQWLPDSTRIRLASGSKWSYWRKSFRHLLMETLDQHAYPMLHRLYGLKALADDEILQALRPGSSDPTGLVRAATEHVEELVELEDIYESPLHFVPLHSGSTYALFYLLITSGKDRSLWKETKKNLRRQHRGAVRKRFAHLALERLGQSREMVSMGRSYYKAIAGLYYLYDDFNDRFVHYNHAIQMAGADFRALLTELVEDRLQTKDP